MSSKNTERIYKAKNFGSQTIKDQNSRIKNQLSASEYGSKISNRYMKSVKSSKTNPVVP